MTSVNIGITTYGRNDKNQYYLPAGYVDAVRRAGGTVCLLAPGDNHAKGQLRHLDGIILAGGGDIHAEHYDGKPHATNYLLDHERDLSDIAIAKYALLHKMPIFAICRGLQVINIIEGGTLYEHLPEQIENVISHRTESSEPIAHPVNAKPDSKLAEIIGETMFPVVSWHHQAIRKLPQSLIATAFSEDQVIEAIEMPTHPWMIGVQWHPELSAGTDPLQQRLFDAFVSYCRDNQV